MARSVTHDDQPLGRGVEAHGSRTEVITLALECQAFICGDAGEVVIECLTLAPSKDRHVDSRQGWPIGLADVEDGTDTETAGASQVLVAGSIASGVSLSRRSTRSALRSWIGRLDQSSGQLAIIKDAGGDYEILSCRPATEYGGNPPLLRIGLRKRVTAPVEEPAPWPSPRPYGR